MKKFLMGFFLLFSFSLSAEDFPGEVLYEKKIENTYLRVNAYQEHQPFLQSLFVLYKCSKAEEWKKLKYKFGYCKILKARKKSKSKDLLIDIFKRAHLNMDHYPCDVSSAETLTVSFKEVCKASGKPKSSSE